MWKCKKSSVWKNSTMRLSSLFPICLNSMTKNWSNYTLWNVPQKQNTSENIYIYENCFQRAFFVLIYHQFSTSYILFIFNDAFLFVILKHFLFFCTCLSTSDGNMESSVSIIIRIYILGFVFISILHLPFFLFYHQTVCFLSFSRLISRTTFADNGNKTRKYKIQVWEMYRIT